MLHKDTRKSGLYILHFPSGHYYGGRSHNIRQRWHLHTSQLRRGVHPNRWMQHVYDKYGPPTVDVLLLIASSDGRVRAEQAWLDVHVGEPWCVNVSKSADASTMEGRHHSVETRQHLSEVLQGRVFTEEHRTRLACRATGRTLTEEATAKIADANRRRTWSAEAKQNASMSHTGKKHSLETRMKMAESARLREARRRASRSPQ